MNKFEVDDYNSILSDVDFLNKINFDSFSDNLLMYYQSMTLDEIEQVVEFLVFDLNVNSDSELRILSIQSIGKMCEFINGIFERHERERYL